MEREKVTEKKWKLIVRNEKMYKDYCNMMNEGWMKSVAYAKLGEKYGIKTIARVYNILQEVMKNHNG